MRVINSVAATALSLLAFASAASAATYYVSPTGSDSNAGTQAKPWKTITKVNATVLKPGDRVLFQGGKSFSGSLALNEPEGGTASKLIVFGSYGTGKATINSGTQAGFAAYNVAGIRIESLKFVGSGRASGNLSDGVSFYTDIPVWNNLLDTVQVVDVETSGYGKFGVSLGSYAYDYVNYIAIKTGFKNVLFDQICTHDNTDGGLFVYGSFNSYYGPGYEWSLVPGYSNYNVKVTNSVAYNNRGIPGKGNNSGNGLVISDVDKGLIENCVAYENGADNDHPGGGPIGIWAWESNNVAIQFNTAFNNHTKTIDGGGFDLDGGCTNSVMQYNLSYNNDGNGYLVYQFYTARPMKDNVVRYNVSINDGRTNGGGLAMGGTCENTLFYGNTVTIGPRDRATNHPGPYAAWVVKDGWTNTNTKFQCNNFIVCDGVPVVYVPDIQLQPGIRFDNNNYLTGRDPFIVIWGDTTFTSLRAWHNATGQE